MALSEEATFRYLEWNDIFRHERPFQILIDIPPDAPDQRRTNCTFASQSKILVKDVRDNLEGFQLDTHGFTFVKHESKLKDTQFKDRVEVEKMYVKECEDLIKQYLEGVDRVHIFNWLVSIVFTGSG
jgi:hypothetical protein